MSSVKLLIIILPGIFSLLRHKNKLKYTLKKGYSDLKKPYPDDRLYSSTYIGYLIRKLRRGGLWNTVTSIYKKIRKYTFISGIIRTLAFIITLLEKSAILLLIVSSLFILFPAIALFAILFSAVCIFRYIELHKSVKSWITGAKHASVYLTAEKCYGKTRNPLFLRCASEEASSFDHPVIVLCSDRIISAKWYGLNLLTVRPDYFFVLKKHYFRHFSGKITYISLS